MDGHPDAAFVTSRRFGDATVTLISEGIFPWTPELTAPEAAWRRAMPEADASGAITLGVNVAHIRLGGASILVDPGFDDPSAAPHEQFVGLVRSEGLIAGLRTIGVEPDTITHVLLTHQHADHVVEASTLAAVLGVPVLASARAAEDLDRVDETLEDGGTVRSGELEIRAIATPGHCHGHLAFLIAFALIAWRMAIHFMEKRLIA